MGGTLLPIGGMHGHILMKLITDTHVHMTLMTFSRSCVQRLRSQTTFSENTLFRRSQETGRRFAVEDHLVT